MIDITPFIPGAQATEKETGIPASITLGKIVLESTSRSNKNKLSGLATNAKNLFGIKGTGTAGTYYAQTSEYDENGKLYSTTAGFRKYNSYDESIADHAALLTKERYTSQYGDKTSIEDYAVGLQKGGYGGKNNTTYASSLLSVIRSNNLTQYDKGSYTLSNPALLTRKDSGASTTEAIQEHKNSSSLMDKIVSKTVYLVVLFAVGVLGIVFFMKAFNLNAPTINITKGGNE